MSKLNPETQKIVNKISEDIVRENVVQGIEYKNSQDLFEKYGFINHDIFKNSISPFDDLIIFKKIIEKNKK